MFALGRVLRRHTGAQRANFGVLVIATCGGICGILLAGYIALTITGYQKAISHTQRGLAATARTTAQYAQLVAETDHFPPMGDQLLTAEPLTVTDTAAKTMTLYLRRLRPARDMQILLLQVPSATPNERTKALPAPQPYDPNNKHFITAEATSENGQIAALVRIPRSDVLPEWWLMSSIAGLGVAFVCILIATFAFRLTLELRRRELSEDQLRRTSEEARVANNAKSELLANMSHELRTPLNAIIGFSEMLKGEFLGPIGNVRYREYGDDIFTSGTHLLSLINNLLDISKAESGHLKLVKEVVSLNFHVEQCLDLVRPLAEKGKIRTILEIDPSSPQLFADLMRLKQILFNLLSNAIKFTPENGEVRVAISHDELDVNITVSDTGIGMTEEQINIALTRFGQIDSKISRHHRGTGLGLPLAVELAKLHGGNLEIRSKPAAGTTIVLSLPTYMASDQAAA